MPKPLLIILGLVLAVLAVFIGVKLGGDDMQTAVKPADPDKPVVAQAEQEAKTAAEKEAEAKKKAEEAKAAAEEAEKKAAEAKAAEEAAKAKKEEERLAAEAEAKRKEEERLAAEAEAKRKEEQERLAAEAKKEEERRAAEEAAREKEEEEKAAAAQAEADRAAELAAQQKQDDAAKIIEPSFDIVRIEDDGFALAAGRAKPGATITLSKNGEAAGTTTANERGEWVIVLEEPLDKGSHQITLQSQVKDGQPVASKQAALVEIPEAADQKPLVVLSDDASASRVLQAPQTAQAEDKEGQDPEGPTQTASASQTQEPEAEPGKKIALSLGAVDYDDNGTLMFSGRVTAGETVRLYVDNSPLADATADKTGSWLAIAQQQIKPGSHNLRIDQIGKDGKPVGRIELPFYREEPAKVAALLKSRGVNVATNEPAATTTDASSSEESTTQTAGNGDGGNTTSETASNSTTETTTSESSQNTAETQSTTSTESDTQQTAGQESTGGGQKVAGNGDGGNTTSVTASVSDTTQTTGSSTASDTATESTSSTTQTASSGDDSSASSETTTASETTSTAGNGDGGNTSSESQSSSDTTQVAAADTGSQSNEQNASSEAETAASTPSDNTQSEETTTASADTSATSEQTETAQTVTPVTGAATPGQVVIQPGNNLWRISRVIYGRGVRYTVIYQANKDQIRDPSLIYPGQIFTTPGVVPPRSIDPELKEPLQGAADPENDN